MASASKKSGSRTARKASSTTARSSSSRSASLPKDHNPANPIGGFSGGSPNFSEERKGLETGSRARTILPESEEPKQETQTLTPIAEPAPAVTR